MEGILLVNKPVGITSHDVVDRVRKKFRIRRVGHAGTLDPLATGLLIVLVGKATKQSNNFMGMDKAYRSTLILGQKTDSGDTEGKTLDQKDTVDVSVQALDEAFAAFQGEGEQLPPMFSAIKHKGKKLYEYARQGITVEREPRPITIHKLAIEGREENRVRFYLECSKGTYVRQLAMDIGDRLGCGACISQIERVKIGSYHLEESVAIEDIDESCLRNIKS